jgi:predicted nucleic acid-binding protein
MRSRVYIDCDIILDLLAERQPFYRHAARLFTLIERKKVTGFVSPLVFANLFYILRKLKSGREAGNLLLKLKLLLKILPVNERIVELALNSGFTDFEDALQYYTAAENGIGIIITRNKKDYRHSEAVIYTAEEYLKVVFTES